MMTTESQPRQSRLSSAFQILWAATGVSNLADGIGLVALPLLAASLTRDPLLIAGVATAQRLPWLLFTLVSGVLVDRADRRVLQRATNLFRALVLCALGVALLLGWASIALLFLVALLLGVAETLFDNAAFALLPNIVARDDLERANGGIFTTQTIANEFAGPPLGGGLFALAAAAPILAGAAIYALAGTLIGLLRGSFRAAPAASQATTTMWGQIGEGVGWFWRHRLLHIMGIKSGLEHGCWAATNAILVLVVQDRLGLDAAGFGALLAASSVGGLIGGLIANRLIARIGQGSTSLLNMVVQGISYLGIALSTNIVVVGLMLGLMSYAGVVGGVVGISFRQAIIPNHLLGRVSSAFRLYGLGSMALGAFAGGLLARGFGLLAPYWLCGAIMFALTIILLPIVNNRTMAQARLDAQQLAVAGD
jgi:MFS family permease